MQHCNTNIHTLVARRQHTVLLQHSTHCTRTLAVGMLHTTTLEHTHTHTLEVRVLHCNIYSIAHIQWNWGVIRYNIEAHSCTLATEDSTLYHYSKHPRSGCRTSHCNITQSTHTHTYSGNGGGKGLHNLTLQKCNTNTLHRETACCNITA